MGKLFGTDGVRGIANKDLKPELAMKLGMAAVQLLKDSSGGKPAFLIGRDTRISGDMLESALAAGMASMGADVYLAGIIPTPAVAYLIRNLGLSGGAVISASHNSMEYNGIKFFSTEGFKLSEELEEEIETLIMDKDFPKSRGVGESIGRTKILLETPQYYENFVKSIAKVRFEEFSIAMDCANGAAHMLAPGIFHDLGADVQAFNAHPSGTNINRNCGSTNPEFLQEVLKTGRFDLGLAFDGDADRLVAVDETGHIVDGDALIHIFARYLAQEDKLPGNIVVTTIMSNLGLETSLSEEGINMVRTNVGDRNVLKEMLMRGAVLGGEQSGHIIFLEYNTTGDGIITALMLMKALKKSGKKLSELRSRMNIYPQVQKSVGVANKEEILKDETLRTLIKLKQEESRGKYRIVVRASGTEPLIRVMAEGPDLRATEMLVDEIFSEIKEAENRILTDEC